MSQQKRGLNYPQFEKQKGHTPSSASAPAARNRGQYHGYNLQKFRARPEYSQGNKVPGVLRFLHVLSVV